MAAKSQRYSDPRRDLAKQLDRIESEVDQLRAMLSTFDPTLAPHELSAAWIKGMLNARRRRERIFGSRLFGAGRWDILLELYAAALAEEPATVNALATAVDAPSNYVSRWIQELERAGLVVRTSDTADRRRVYVTLSADASAAMADYFGDLCLEQTST